MATSAHFFLVDVCFSCRSFGRCLCVSVNGCVCCEWISCVRTWNVNCKELQPLDLAPCQYYLFKRQQILQQKTTHPRQYCVWRCFRWKWDDIFLRIILINACLSSFSSGMVCVFLTLVVSMFLCANWNKLSKHQLLDIIANKPSERYITCRNDFVELSKALMNWHRLNSNHQFSIVSIRRT